MPADAADDLYGLPLDAFVPERDALAKRLRAEGRRADAAEVKGLRKPSVAAWAVNQAVRSQPKAARALWQAGDELIGAQEALLSGRGDAAALRAAAERERAAVDDLLGAARGLLTEQGKDLGEGTIERVRETLHAAAIDPDVRDDVAAGRATRERAHAGLGGFGVAVPPPDAPARKKPPAKRPAAEAPAPEQEEAGERATATKAEAAAEERRAEAARRERERAEAEERERVRREAARRRADAERDLRDAARVREKAERAAARADQRLDEARAAAEEANAALDDARIREREAAEDLELARQDADAAG